MAELFECTECGEKVDSVFVVTGKRVGKKGILSTQRGMFCLKCLDEWAFRQRRAVSSMEVVTYLNPEVGRVSSKKICEENGQLCIKPKVWEELKGD